MTTVHAATASQAVVDQAAGKGKSYRGGRAERMEGFVSGVSGVDF